MGTFISSGLALGGLSAFQERHTHQEEERHGEKGPKSAVCQVARDRCQKQHTGTLGKSVPKLRGAEARAIFQQEIKMCL